MKTALWGIFEILVTLFESAVSMHFVCRFLGLDFSERKSRKHWFALILCYGLTVTAMNLLMPYEGAFVLIYSMIVFLYTLIFLQSSVIKKAAASLLFLCIIIMDSSFGVNLVSSLMRSSASEIYTESDLTRFITLVIVQSLNLLVFQILEKTICSGALKLKMRTWVLLGSVFLLSILCFTLIQIAALHIQMGQVVRLCFLGADLSLILIDYITIRLLSTLHRQQQTELENSQMKMQLQYQAQYADTVRQQEESVHRLRHDLKTTISALHDFLARNQKREMEQYLETYALSLSETASIVHTNQPFLNAILNTKLTFAKEKGIACSCHSPGRLPAISGLDYCSLLGNLLDNAIEASAEVSENEIAVSIDYTDFKLTITVKNRIQKSILGANPHLHTTKSNHPDHGFGISAIKSTAAKYNGTADFYENNGWFIASVILYTQ